MEWTKDPDTLNAFHEWITNQSGLVGKFVEKLHPQIKGPNDSVLLFYTFAKFSHLYTLHTNAHFDEDRALSIHRVMNTLMEEESTRILFQRLAQAATNGAVGA
tara:strand:- start:209 stop:517 length:309 start_codon:yes stop_codon:yes gene_type:complete